MADADDARIAGNLSVAYLIAVAGRMLQTFPLDFLDLLLVATVANSNETGRVPARGKAAAREWTGISRNAISRALNVPLETVRRRVAALITKNILREQPDGLVLAPDNPMGLGNSPEMNAYNLEMLRALFSGLKANGIDLE